MDSGVRVSYGTNLVTQTLRSSKEVISEAATSTPGGSRFKIKIHCALCCARKEDYESWDGI